MAVLRDFAVAVQVVEHDGVARDLVRVRRHVFAEERQRRVAVAQIAQHLIEGWVGTAAASYREFPQRQSRDPDLRRSSLCTRRGLRPIPVNESASALETVNQDGFVENTEQTEITEQTEGLFPSVPLFPFVPVFSSASFESHSLVLRLRPHQARIKSRKKGIIPVWNDSFFLPPFFRLIGSEPRPSLTFVRG
jgi:hypothetical protein